MGDRRTTGARQAGRLSYVANSRNDDRLENLSYVANLRNDDRLENLSYVANLRIGQAEEPVLRF